MALPLADCSGRAANVAYGFREDDARGTHGQDAVATGKTRSAAFTLLEIILVLCILVLLAGSVSLGVFSWQDSTRLDEGARRYESLLLMARAEAANTGRRFQLTFQQQDSVVTSQFQWEPDPLKAPGKFSPYAGPWVSLAPSDQVKVTLSQRTGSSAYSLLANSTSMPASQASDSNATLDAITFYPDGTSDSAIIELTSLSERDGRRAFIEIDGQNGTINTFLLGGDDLTDYCQRNGLAVEKVP